MDSLEIIDYLQIKAEKAGDTIIMWKLNEKDYAAVRDYLSMDQIDEGIFYTTAKLWHAPIDPTNLSTYAVGSKGVYRDF